MYMNLLSTSFKRLTGAMLLLWLVSCGSGEGTTASENKEGKNEAENTTMTPSQNPVYKKGLGLIAKSDCLTCHKIEDKLVGPTYTSVAEKYAGAPNDVITALAQKIIKGGVGNWGNVPMLPHPALSQEEAETMVRYILLLKK